MPISFPTLVRNFHFTLGRVFASNLFSLECSTRLPPAFNGHVLPIPLTVSHFANFFLFRSRQWFDRRESGTTNLRRTPTDWFKAGKGPDPKVASMDRSLANYWNSKSTADSGKTDKPAEGGNGAVAMSGVTEANGVDGVDPDL